MSSGTEPNSPESEGLQFDHAEFDQGEPAKVACAACKRPIVDRYYELNGTIFCDPCRASIEAQLRGGWAAKMVRAVVFGTGAAVLSTIVYATFLAVTKINLSLLAIGVGFFVGKSVRKGSRNLGGASFQLLAVFLTYTSIAMAYFAGVVITFLNEPPEAPVPPNPPGVAANPNPGPQQPAPANRPGRLRKGRPAAAPPAPAAAPEGPQPAPVAAAANPEFSIGDLVKFLGLAIGVAFATPVLMAQESPFSLLFVGLGVWEAWKFNKRAKIVFTGPYWINEDEAVPGDQHA